MRFWALFKLAISGKVQYDFTKGSIGIAAFLLAVPMVLEMAMESLFAVVDIFFVGMVSTNATATVGLTESVITLVYSVAIGLSMAATAMVSRRIGEDREDAAAVAAGVPLIAGAIAQWEGQVTLYDPAQDAPCLSCIFPKPPQPGQTAALG